MAAAGTRPLLRASALVALATSGLAACASVGPGPAMTGPGVRAYNRSYAVRGRWYTPTRQPGYDVVGTASWYSYESGGRTTADGERFDPALATAAHTTLPIPSYLDVTDLDNGRTVRVRLNDRGPFAPGRIIDLSRGAAEALGFLNKGTAHVRVRYVGPAPLQVRPELVLARVAPPRDERPPRAGAWARDDVPRDPDRPDRDPAPSFTYGSTYSYGYGVQAAAYADVARAEQAQARLASAGGATIRPLDRSGGRLYRVVVGPCPDVAAARVAQARAVALGFPGARVIQGY